MKNKSHKIISLAIAPCIIMVFIMIATICEAREWSRNGKGEIYGLIQNMGGDRTSGSWEGIEALMEIGGTSVMGFGYGNNLNNHVNLNGDIWFGSASVTTKALGFTVKGDTTLVGWDINLDIYPLKSRFTPLVSGGVGFIIFNGDFEGFSFGETDLSYNLGGGFRWDVTDHFLIKALYKATRTTLKETDKSLLLDGVTVMIGYSF